MNTVRLTKNFGITGTVIGTTANPVLSSRINAQNVTTATQAGTAGALVSQVYDYASGTNYKTIALSTTLTLDLTSGLLNPLGEAIVFSKIKSVYIEHISTSTAVSIKCFAAASNAFQGPLNTANYVTLLPGESIYLQSYTTAGWTVDGTHKNLSILNNSGSASALVRIYIDGTT
jgi:hypothetical protein